MREAIVQTFQILWAHKLRSFLTMFGIAWGVISVVILSATGEGFRQGNEHVLQELGQNIGITWGGRTSLQAGGERAGRRVFLTVEDARAIQAEAALVRVATPEIIRGGMKVKSAYNAGAPTVHGVEPSYQQVRTIDVERGRQFNWEDERLVNRVAILGADITKQLFQGRDPLGEAITLNGLAYTVVGTIRYKNQDSNYSGPDNDKVFVPFATMARDFPRAGVDRGVVSNIIVAPQQWVVDDLPRQFEQRTGRIRDIDWALERNVREVLARRKGFDPADREAIAMWDTSVNSLMFGRMVDTMRDFFTAVGFVTLALGGIGVMNIMLIAVKERTKEIGVRKALGATRFNILLQFVVEAMVLCLLGGSIGIALGTGIAALLSRVLGWSIVVSPGAVGLAFGFSAAVGLFFGIWPARKAARLDPIEALRYE